MAFSPRVRKQQGCQRQEDKRVGVQDQHRWIWRHRFWQLGLARQGGSGQKTADERGGAAAPSVGKTAPAGASLIQEKGEREEAARRSPESESENFVETV